MKATYKKLSLFFIVPLLTLLVLLPTISVSFAEETKEEGEIPMTGKFWDGSKVISHTYKVPFVISNGTLDFFYGYNLPGETGLIAQITSDIEVSDGLFEFQLPRNYPYKNINTEGFIPVLLVNNQEISHEPTISADECFYEFSVPFDNDNSIYIEVFLDYRPTDDFRFPNYGDDVAELCLSKTIGNYSHNQFILAPYQQIKQGTSPANVLCMYPYEIHFKNDTVPLCLKPGTYEKLMNRGYF